jgi:hypothetical protein
MSHEGVTLVVKHVPAEICDTCGEPCFDEQVTSRLLDRARGAAAAEDSVWLEERLVEYEDLLLYLRDH